MVFLILDTNHNLQSNTSLSPSRLFDCVGKKLNYEFQDKADHPQQCSLPSLCSILYSDTKQKQMQYIL